MTLDLKFHPCDYCGSEDYTVVMRGPDLLEGLPGEFQLTRCNQCGLLRQNPRLDWEQLADYYPEGYVSHNGLLEDSVSGFKRFERRYGHWKRVRRIAKYKPEGTWLDIGCGSGLNLQEAQFWQRWTLFGLEPVPAMAAYVQDNLGIPVFNTTLEEFTGHEGEFDIITMWDVLEHLAYPVAALEKIARLLKPGGILMLSTPNLESFDRAWFKEAWVGYELPRHLYLFPRPLLKQVLAEKGLRFLAEFCLAGAHATLMLSISYLQRNHPSRFLGWVASHKDDYLPFRAMTLLPVWVIDKLKRSTNITLVVRKV
jgi:2-polyprenyl-3-methyl-5-hydroxy-6-metoxy-1,4-benzoquinol methylase